MRSAASRGAFCQRNTAFDEACGTAALLAAAAALALAARQIAAPAVLRGAPELGVDVAVDALVGDHSAAIVAGEPACDLFRRPALSETLQHRAAQAGLPVEARACPAPRSCLLLGIARLVADLPASIALQLTRDR
ncbi:hypothetical protein AC629_35615 [Bradyrhizobium sp. NAS80.1]|nr:hypothetical protein AC629_35615 [Bradyrhizobium sp. NAS80.1]